MARDIVSVASPKTVKVLFENDKMRVLEVTFRKGQKVAMHSHPPNFLYAVTSARFKSTSPDGKSTIVKMKKGESAFSEGSSHSVESQVPSVALQVELK